jgi:hypothetical protein
MVERKATLCCGCSGFVRGGGRKIVAPERSTPTPKYFSQALLKALLRHKESLRRCLGCLFHLSQSPKFKIDHSQLIADIATTRISTMTEGAVWLL